MSRRTAASAYTAQLSQLTPYGGPWQPGRSWLWPPILWGALFLGGVGASMATPEGFWPRVGVGALGLALSLLLAAVMMVAHLAEQFSEPLRLYLAANVLAGATWLSLVYATSALPVVAGSWGAFGWTAASVWSLLVVITCWFWHTVKIGQISHEQKILQFRQQRLDAELRRQHEHLQQPATEPQVIVKTQADVEREQWEADFKTAGLEGLEFLGLRITRGNNFQLLVRFPRGGRLKFSSLEGALEQLTMVLSSRFNGGLRAGAITAQRAKNAAGQRLTTEAIINVDVEDILRHVIYLPDDHTPLSIYNAFQVGKLADGSPWMLTPANVHRMIIGMTRKGKSNFLHVLIHQLSRCTDAIIWMVDFKGGRTARPWFQRIFDMLTGRIHRRPIIDWIAVDRFEAERLFLAAIAAAKARPGIADGTKWEPTPAQPAILVIVDEMSEGTGNASDPGFGNLSQGITSSDMADLVSRGLFLGAGEAIYYNLANQNAAVSAFLSSDAQSQLAETVGFPADDSGGIFDGPNAAAARLMHAELEHEGSAVIKGPSHPYPVEGKAWFVGDGEEMLARIAQAVELHSPLRPELDAATAEAIEEYGYSTRWDPDRIAWLLRIKPSVPPRRWNDPRNAAGPASVPASTGAAAAVMDSATVLQAFGLDDMESPFGADDTVVQDGSLSPHEASEWEAIQRQYQEQVQTEPAATADTVKVPATGYGRFVELVRGAGRPGITAADAYRLLDSENLAPATKPTIYTWRDRAIRDRLVVQPVPGYGSRIIAVEHYK